MTTDPFALWQLACDVLYGVGAASLAAAGLRALIGRTPTIWRTGRLASPLFLIIAARALEPQAGELGVVPALLGAVALVCAVVSPFTGLDRMVLGATAASMRRAVDAVIAEEQERVVERASVGGDEVPPGSTAPGYRRIELPGRGIELDLHLAGPVGLHRLRPRTGVSAPLFEKIAERLSAALVADAPLGRRVVGVLLLLGALGTLALKYAGEWLLQV